MFRSGSICMSFLYNYLLSDSEYKDKDGKTFNKNTQKLRCLSETFQNYGGLLGKLSQILCYNDPDNSAFSDCKPFSKDKTIKYIKDEFKNNPVLNNNISSIDFNVYKSGSVGQVHKAVHNNGDKIIFKVRYVGLIEQTKTDLNILDKITSYIYYFADMKNAMVDIKTQMYKELDYDNERENQELMYKLWDGVSNIEIPKVIPELCSNTYLSMHYVDGKCLQDFIKSASQEAKNRLGTSIVEFVFTNIYKYGILYSDVHYGNFLAKEDGTLCVLDFGCLQKIKKTLLNNIRELHKCIQKLDEKKFYNLVKVMGIIKDDISYESKKYIYEYFCLQYEPWTSHDFEFTDEWLDKATEKNTKLMEEWLLPQDMVYFNRIPYGMMHLLTKLKLRGNFSDKILQNIKMS